MTAAALDRPAALTMNPGHPPAWQFQEGLALAALPNAVPCVRMLVNSVSRDWQLAAAEREIAEHLAGELVAHAVATTGVTEVLPLYDEVFDNLALIYVRIRLAPGYLEIEVQDRATKVPDMDKSLSAVAFYSQDAGFYFPPDGGRVVWCSLVVEQSKNEITTQLPRILPRRKPRVFRAPDEPVEPMRDSRILGRVLEGLQVLDQQPRSED